MTEDNFLENEREIILRAPCAITVGSKIYKVKQISNKIRTKISDLEKEVYLLERQAKNCSDINRSKRIDHKLRTLHSKTAAYYLLNNKALFIPFLFCITWHILDLKDSEHTLRINQAGMNNRGMDFFLANWQITKAQLALSTRLVGEGIKQYQERMENAENMLEEDGSETKKAEK